MIIYYLIGGFCFFGLISVFRYMILFRIPITSQTEVTSSYDIGKQIQECRNKNLSSSKKSQHKSPLTPVISDSTLAGANIFHQYMLIDDFVYEGISKMSGEHIDNFSDLSSKLKDYSYDTGGLTEGSLNKIKGHIAESHVAQHLKEAGAQVSLPETSNQTAWDLLLNENPVQVKLIKDVNSLTKHFKDNPNIPVLIPSDSNNIPETAFHFDPSEGVENLMNYLGKQSANKIIVDHSLSHTELTESIEKATDFPLGDIDFSFPIVTVAFSGFREFRLLRKNDTDILSSLKNLGLDVAGIGIGIQFGGLAGASIGTAISPGIGTVIGSLIGCVVGATSGRKIANKIKHKPLKQALESWKKSAENLQQQIQLTENKYQYQFQKEQKKEQNYLKELSDDIKEKMDKKIKNLRKQIAEREKPSEKLKTCLLKKLNSIPTKIVDIKKEKGLHWTEYFWPKHETINDQRQRIEAKKLLFQVLQTNKFIDRGQLFQKFSDKGICREYIFSEIEKTEQHRLEKAFRPPN